MVKAQFTMENTITLSQRIVSLHYSQIKNKKRNFTYVLSTSNREILSQKLVCVLLPLKEMKGLYSYIKEGFTFLYGWCISLLWVSETEKQLCSQEKPGITASQKVVLPGAQKILKICICLLQLFIQTGTECGFALVSSKKRNFCTFERGSENQK